MRKIVVLVHRYVGLAVALLLLVSGLTGSVLVFEREIDRALNPGLVVIPPPASDELRIDQVLRNAKQAVPDQSPRFVFISDEATDAAEVQFLSGTIRLHVDPYTGKILGQRHPTASFTGFLTDLHIHLLAGETGEQVLGWAGIGALVLCFLGIVLWWPKAGRWKQAFAVKWRAAPFRVWYDAHRVTGAVAAGLIFMTALTGSSLALYELITEPALIALTGEGTRKPSPKSQLRTSDPISPPLRASVDAMLAQAASIYPTGKITRITLPARPADAVAVRMRLDGEIHQFGRTFIWFDQYDGKLLRVDDALKANTAVQIQSWLYPLHTGTYGGILTQCLQALAGIALALLSLSGIWMWAKRNRSRARQTAPRKLRTPDPASP